jgi:hypothetical protein
VSWLAVPFLASPALSAALRGHSTAVVVVTATLAWGSWTAALVATLLPRTTSLTIYRIIAPGAVAATGWAALGGAGPLAGATALAVAAVAAVVAYLPATGDVFVDGSSYGPERRLALRVPGALLLGPVELAWLVAFGGVAAGPLLLAARQWIAGGLLVVVGWPAARVAALRLHTLARRWIVLVPAGLVVHDPLTLADAVLFARRTIASIAPAAEHNPALDLTGAALGLAVQITFTEPQEVSVPSPQGRRHPPDTVAVAALLCTPTRPAHLFDAAAANRLPVRDL